MRKLEEPEADPVVLSAKAWALYNILDAVARIEPGLILGDDGRDVEVIHDGIGQLKILSAERGPGDTADVLVEFVYPYRLTEAKFNADRERLSRVLPRVPEDGFATVVYCAPIEARVRIDAKGGDEGLVSFRTIRVHGLPGLL